MRIIYKTPDIWWVPFKFRVYIPNPKANEKIVLSDPHKDEKEGGLAERSNAPVLKTDKPKGFGSSNLSSAATTDPHAKHEFRLQVYDKPRNITLSGYNKDSALSRVMNEIRKDEKGERFVLKDHKGEVVFDSDYTDDPMIKSILGQR